MPTPYKVRRINWALLVNPSMQGLRTEAEADARKFANIGGGLSSIGAGIVRNRQERESKRRFDAQQSLRQAAFDERKADQDTRRSILAENAASLSERVQAGDDTAIEPFRQVVDALNGPKMSLEEIIKQARGCGNPGQRK